MCQSGLLLLTTAVLGISAVHHDSGAALVVDGEIIAAEREEPFSRKKHDAGLPQRGGVSSGAGRLLRLPVMAVLASFGVE